MEREYTRETKQIITGIVQQELEGKVKEAVRAFKGECNLILGEQRILAQRSRI